MIDSVTHRVVEPLNQQRTGCADHQSSDGPSSVPGGASPAEASCTAEARAAAWCAAVATLAASPPGGDALSRSVAETLLRLAKLVAGEYSVCVRKDGGCHLCFLWRVSLALEGEGWTMGRELSELGEHPHNL